MDKEDNKDSLEEIVDAQCKKLNQLDVATKLIKSKNNINGELARIHEEVSQVSYGVVNMRKTLEKMKEQNVHFRNLLSLIETLDKKIIYQEENVPPELIQGFECANKQLEPIMQTAFSSDVLECNVNSTCKLKTPCGYACNNSYAEKQSAMKDCKRTLFNEPEVCPTISLITVEEFNKVPKYMIGRQTLETMNGLINAINQTLIAKYTILALGKAAAQKKGEVNLYLHYKKQEFDIREENGYLYFFTAEDYYMQTKTKIDKTKLNLITALRHCKRLREYRTKSELRYVITPH